MKRLYLVRHATAAKRTPDLPDFQRPLIKKGEKEAAVLAKKLTKTNHPPDLMISSPAARALETAHIFARSLDYPLPQILIKDALYEDLSDDAFLYILNNLDDAYGSVMIFGHDPMFSDFASYLVEAFDEPIPKSGVVSIEFVSESWKNVSEKTGRLQMFDFPKKMAKHFKALKKGMKTELMESILSQLEDKDPKAAKTLTKTVKKAASRIIDEFIQEAKAEAEKKEIALTKSMHKLAKEEKPKKKKKGKKAKDKSESLVHQVPASPEKTEAQNFKPESSVTEVLEAPKPVVAKPRRKQGRPRKTAAPAAEPKSVKRSVSTPAAVKKQPVPATSAPRKTSGRPEKTASSVRRSEKRDATARATTAPSVSKAKLKESATAPAKRKPGQPKKKSG